MKRQIFGHCIIWVVLFSLFVSCTKEEQDAPIEGTITDENGPITLELTNLTATTALFKGSVNLDLYSKYEEVGVIYSLKEDLEINPIITHLVPIKNIDKNNRFEKKMEGLLYGTKYYYSSYICMNGIYKYGEVQTFTTDAVTMEVSAPTVTSTTATFKGKVAVSEEDAESISFGIAWSAGNDFEMNVNEEDAELAEDGTFAVTVSGLKMDTEYRYATCIRQLGSQYGEVKKFTTAAASMSVSATQITQTSVTFTGEAERSAEDEDIEYGILYSTGEKLEVGAEGCIRKVLTEAFDDKGKFSLKVDGLMNDTKYNYCWYARQGSTYKYGFAQEFTTSSVTINLSVDPITQTTATFKGNYEQPDGEGFEIGILYALNPEELTIDSDAAIRIELSEKNFSHKISGLQYNTTYHYCTYIRQNGDCKYGSRQEFKTRDVIVEVAVNDVTQTTATFNGKTEITETDVIEVGILYSTNSSLSVTSSSTSKIILSDGDFSYKVDGLKNNTQYYYRHYVKYGDEYEFGETRDFMTTSVSATLSEPSVTQTTATFSGTVNFAETTSIEFGILYSTSNTLTATSAGVKKVETTPNADGTFSCKAEGLQYSTTYYYCYYACQDGTYTYGSVSEFTTSSVIINLSVDSVTQTTATFTGNVELTEDVETEFGILYSEDSYLVADRSGVVKQPLTPDSSGNVLFKAEGLMYNTTYNYCYYICQNGAYSYGIQQAFTTKTVSMNLWVDSITQTTATFNIEMDWDGSGCMEVGILYYAAVEESPQTKQVFEPTASESISFTAENLRYATPYRYFYYFILNGKATVGETEGFTTLGISSVDLSVSGTANCYIVSDSGQYKIKAVKGNSTDSVGKVASTEVLWESFGTSVSPEVGDLIAWTSFSEDYISFEVPSEFKKGNAVIAAKDDDNTILWSWHIWLTDEPQSQIYYNGAGTMMDRNLGATSVIPGDVGTLGLLYQWGRKDPFLGSSHIRSDNEAMSTIVFPSAVLTSSSTGTVEYVISNPTTYVTSNSDWYYGAPNNSLWQYEKTIYDPCPVGWRVPDGGEVCVWSTAIGSSHLYYTYDDTNMGMNFTGILGDDEIIWYPNTGFRDRELGILATVGDYGLFWSCTYSDVGNFANGMCLSRDSINSQISNRATGCAVRCLKE